MRGNSQTVEIPAGDEISPRGPVPWGWNTARKTGVDGGMPSFQDRFLFGALEQQLVKRDDEGGADMEKEPRYRHEPDQERSVTTLAKLELSTCSTMDQFLALRDSRSIYAPAARPKRKRPTQKTKRDKI